MDELSKSILLYSTSTAAQVWSALLVFWVLLVRDKNARISQEIGAIWIDAKFWWTGLIQYLRAKVENNQFVELNEIGLDDTAPLRAETDVESFKKILKATKVSQIIKNENLSSETSNRLRTISGPSFQSTMDALAERLENAEIKYANPKKAFLVGIIAIFLNMAMLLFLKIFDGFDCALKLIAIFNAIGFAIFIFEVWPALSDH